MTPEEKIKDIVEFIYTGDNHYDESIKKIKDMLKEAFHDGLTSVDEEVLEHPSCPDFEDWWKGDI